MKLRSDKKGISKIMFVIVSLLLVAFVGAIVLKFVGDYISTTMAGGKPMSLVSDLLGGI